ncbi:uncharacterized protein LOC134222860 [Armigeres subalbatus]|uniref:uncharacterized protein LOC134222860 n=1 Tax=Armigeres subalbatus TaxID=124917 RepID=UPI002ED687B9
MRNVARDLPPEELWGGSTPPPQTWSITPFFPSPSPSLPVVGSGPATPPTTFPRTSPSGNNPPTPRTRTTPYRAAHQRGTSPLRTTLALQWNLNRFFNNICDLELLVANSEPLAIALQEIHRTTPTGMDRALGGRYKWFADVNQNAYQSAAVGVLKDIPTTEILVDAGIPMVAVRVEWPFPLTIASLYIPNGKHKDLRNKLVGTFESLPAPVLILGDVNGYHHSWGSRSDNTRGKLVFSAASDTGLTVLNDGSPTFRRGTTESAIDVSLASSVIVGKLLWSSDDDSRGSDHMPIMLALNGKPEEISRRPRRKALRALKRGKDQLQVGHPDLEELRTDYQAARNECRQTIREEKEKSWTNFLDGINSNQPSAELWRRVNCFQGKRKAKGISLKINGTVQRDPSAVADALADEFGRHASYLEYPDHFRKTHRDPSSEISAIQIPPDSGEEFNRPFTFAELEYALQKGKGKSAGPDDLGYPMLNHLPVGGKTILLISINKEWQEGTLPTQWKSSFVMPISEGRGSPNDVDNYRPIALTSVVSKIMESMANRRIIELLEKGGHLDNRQHAFRPGKGTNTYFAALGQILDDARRKGHHVEMASLDLSKAYNRTWTPGVLKKLKSWGITGNMKPNIKSNQGRNRGPPGLSNCLFLIAMEGVFDRLPKGIYILVYADDVLLVVTGKHPKATRRKLQAAVNDVAKWAKSAGYVMSAGKCSRAHICSINHRPPTQPIAIDKFPISSKKTCKILGVTVDRKLNFSDHCNRVRGECASRINIVKSISKRRSRSDRPTRLRVANAIICSRLLYGIELSSLNLDNLIALLGPTYNRIVSGLLPSTLADVACAEAGVLPFRFQATAALCSRAIGHSERTKASQNHDHLNDNANTALHNLCGKNIPKIAGLRRLGPRHWQTPPPKVDLKLKERLSRNSNPAVAQETFKNRIRERYQKHDIRFTDGSKAAGRVGIGIYSSTLDESYRLSDRCTVYSAEAAAIFRAMAIPSTLPILIVSDSASVLTALASSASKHPWIQAIESVANRNTTLLWVSGHAGIPGNEYADALANLGRSDGFMSREVPAPDAKLWVKTEIATAWAKDWRRQRNFCRMLKNASALTNNNISKAYSALQNNPLDERNTINFLKDAYLYTRI